jgi:hypothetical protein
MRRDDVELPDAPVNDRPNANYRCGAACAGKDGSQQVCTLGPSARGRCQHDKEPCQPEPTANFRAKRVRRLVLCCGLLVLCLGGFLWGREFYKPGNLSTPHAQILSGKLTSASCAACHPQAETSPMTWFLSGHAGSELVQSDRCMDCHHTRLPRQYARTAHNLPPSELTRLQAKVAQATPVKLANWIPKPNFSLDDVACAACHREHAGADASLTSLSDAQCQTCHSQQFKSFAEGHPAWTDWPYTNQEPIAFDHRSHSIRHFPSHKDENGVAAVFDCVRCHKTTATGDFARVGDYASNCGECHDQSLNQQSGQRLDLFVMPSLMEPESLGLNDWPIAATGFYDGAVGPLARVFLQQKPELANALKSIPGDGNFARIQPSNPDQQQAAQVVAVALREWIQELASKGPVPAATELPAAAPEMSRVLQGLSPQLVWDASQRWFTPSRASTNRNAENQAKPIYRPAAVRQPTSDDALTSDPLASDPLLEDQDILSEGNEDDSLEESLEEDVLMDDALSESQNAPSVDTLAEESVAETPRTKKLDFNPTTMQPAGGWYVDDTRMAISYRGYGHADPVLKSAIELAAGLPHDSSIRRELLSSGPAVGCIQCHRTITNPGVVVWKPQPTTGSTTSSFTKFAHGPHMNLPVLADCKHCHVIDEQGASLGSESTMSTVSLNGATSSGHDFSPMKKQQCVSCHTASAAGDACVKCHRYHTDDLTQLK